MAKKKAAEDCPDGCEPVTRSYMEPTVPMGEGILLDPDKDHRSSFKIRLPGGKGVNPRSREEVS